MKRILRLGAVLGAGAAIFAACSASPALADDRDRAHIRRDIEDIRHDEYRIRDLERRRDEQLRCRDWRGARRTEDEIYNLRAHIERDRRDVRHDIRESREDRWRGDRYRDDHWRNDRWHDERYDRWR